LSPNGYIDQEMEVQTIFNGVWMALQDIINSNAFRNAVKLFCLVSTNKDKVEEALKFVNGIKKNDILWITRTSAAGLTTIKSRICLGYTGFENCAPKNKAAYLLYTLTHEIGHYLMDKLHPDEIWTPNFSLNIKTILENRSLNLSKKERELIKGADGFEGGFALQFLLYESAEANYFQDKHITEKFINPASYKNWPVFTDKEIANLSSLEINVKLSGVLYLMRRMIL